MLEGILKCHQDGQKNKYIGMKNGGHNENWGRYPSALLCDICGNLMRDAYLTPCCKVNGCFCCLQGEIINLSEQFMNLDVDTIMPEKIQELTVLYGKCPFCLKHELGMQQLLSNTQLQSIIVWFERQRAYRTDISFQTKDTHENPEEINMQSTIEKMLQDWFEHDKRQEEFKAQQKQLQKEKEQQAQEALIAATNMSNALKQKAPRMKTNAELILEF